MGSIGEPTSPHWRSSPTLLPDGSTCHEGTNEDMAQLLKVQCFTVTADGYGAGDDQRLDQPFGHLSPQELFTWRSNTASGAFGDGGPQTRGIDDLFARDMHHGIGAEIMGRNKFSPFRGPFEDHPEWEGWWGDAPPFHTPVFVLSHFNRAPLTLSDTTFHFVSGPLDAVLEEAKAAANGRDVRLGGGVTTIREFLDADLVDTLHIVVSPLTAGHGVRLWERPEDLLDRFHLERIPSPSGVEHLLLWRRTA